MDPSQQFEDRNNQEMPDYNEDMAEMDNNENSSNEESCTNLCNVDNSKTVISKIANLYAERLMSDVCLVVGNVSISKNVLLNLVDIAILPHLLISS